MVARRPRIDEVVGWRVERRHPLTVVGVWVGRVVDAALAVVLLQPFWVDIAGEMARPSLPLDPELDLGLTLHVTGNAAWLPAARWGPQRVRLTQREASLNSTGLEGRETVLPLERLELVAMTPKRRRPRRRAGSRWSAELADGEHRVHLEGTWLALAWLGHLAGWDEPETDSS